MKKSVALSKTEQKAVTDYLFNEFTFGNALTATLLATIVIFFSLFMLNAVVLNSLEIVPQMPFEEFVAERFNYYATQQNYEINPEENIIANLIASFLVILVKIVFDALDYILFGVQSTSVYTAASIVFATNLVMILLVYITIYRNQVKTKTLVISIIIGFYLSCLVVNFLAWLVLALSLSPALLGYFGWWIFLPTTTISLPVLIEWIAGVSGIWIVFWYIFAFFLSSITAISVFVGSRFDRKKLPEPVSEKLQRIRERDDNYTWYIISTLVVSVVSVVWKQIARLVVEFFSIYPSPESNNEPILQHWIGGTPTNVLDARGTFVAFFVLITVGYVIGFMLSYSIYRRAAGQKNWLELYKARHPSKSEQLVRWFVYTTLMSVYWMYSIYFPRHLFLAEDWLQTALWSAVITAISVVAGAATRIEFK